MSAENVVEQSLVAPQPASTGAMKVIKINRNERTGEATSAEIQEVSAPRFDSQDATQMMEAHVVKEASKRSGRTIRSMKEAATLATFPSLLRDGILPILFNSYNETPVTWNKLAFTQSSNKPAEDWLELNQLGLLPAVGELNPYPEIDGAVDRAVRIVNTKRGMIFAVSEEMWKFDRLNMIRQYPDNLGRAARMTQEQAVYSVLTTTANYTRNSTTGDNDIGANTATATFSATTLNTAIATLQTMRDRKSGTPLNINPNTLVVAPRLAIAAQQLIMSPMLVRASANNAAEVYGTGQRNGFGFIDNIIVTPFLGGGSTQYNWILGERGKGLVYQDVEPLQMLTLGADAGNLSEGYFVYDKIRYRVRIWFGAGMQNDRFWYYSDSNTAPAVG